MRVMQIVVALMVASVSYACGAKTGLVVDRVSLPRAIAPLSTSTVTTRRPLPVCRVRDLPLSRDPERVPVVTGRSVVASLGSQPHRDRPGHA
jgi:ribose/xylose/arabinose/galactoside ABC-type transport system permease subunit